MLVLSVGVSHVAGRGAQQALQRCQRWICSAFGVDVGAVVIGQWPVFAGDGAAIQGTGRKALARGAIKRLLPYGSHAFCRISPPRRHTSRSKAGGRHFPFAAMAGLPQGPRSNQPATACSNGQTYAQQSVSAKQQRRVEAGFALTELLISSVLLALFCGAGLQVFAAANGLALEGRKQMALLAWMDRQLQRDEGVLRRLAPASSIDCSDSSQLVQLRTELLDQLQRAGTLPLIDSLLSTQPRQRLVEVQGDRLLVALEAAAPLRQRRERLYSLEGLGVCK